MHSRRRRQSRTGQKFTAAPSDLRTRGRSGPVRVTYTGDAEAAAKQLRDLGFRCSECGVESRFAFSVDQALRFGSGAVEGLREMVLVLRREFGDACVVMLCDACGTVDACIPNGPNSWAPVTPFAGDQ